MALARAALEVRPEHIKAGDVWVATAADGSIAGIVALGPSDQPRTLDLKKLFVAPQRIGSGVGRMLLAYAMAEARRRGARRLTILSDPYAAVSTSVTARSELAWRHPMRSPAGCCRCSRSAWIQRLGVEPAYDVSTI